MWRVGGHWWKQWRRRPQRWWKCNVPLVGGIITDLRQQFLRDSSLAVLRDKVGAWSTKRLIGRAMKFGTSGRATASTKRKNHRSRAVVGIGPLLRSHGQHIDIQIRKRVVCDLTQVLLASVFDGHGHIASQHGSIHVYVAGMSRQLRTWMRCHLINSRA